jgi:hypothetical protein
MTRITAPTEETYVCNGSVTALPYVVHLDIKSGALDLIDVISLAEACTDQ